MGLPKLSPNNKRIHFIRVHCKPSVRTREPKSLPSSTNAWLDMQKKLWRNYLCMQERLTIVIDTWCFRRHALEVKGSRWLNTLGIISWQKNTGHPWTHKNILAEILYGTSLPTWILHQNISKSSKVTLALYNCEYQGFSRSALKLPHVGISQDSQPLRSYWYNSAS